MNHRTITFTAGLVLVWIIGYLLIIGRNLLIPIVIAIFIWHLLNTIREGVQRIPFVGFSFTLLVKYAFGFINRRDFH